MSPSLYARSGVDTDEADRALSRLLHEVSPTLAYGPPSEVGVGHFAAVIRVGPLQLALTTDGVGSKLLIAQLVGRFDTVGIDCVAMNVNDLLCVGATPLVMLDYLAIEQADADVFAEIGRGLAEGARQAEVSIVGGETAQVPDMLRGPVEGRALDLVGMALGVVPEGALLDGSRIEPGDVVIGVSSSGIHSNGLSLARSALLHRFKLDSYLDELGTTLAEELLRPTRIYTPQVKALHKHGIRARALAHITGDGLLNLRRVEAPVGFELFDLPEPPPIFSLVERFGEVPRGEMRTVFNMGIGLTLVVDASDVDTTLDALHRSGDASGTGDDVQAWPIGRAVADPERRIRIADEGLVGGSKHFEPGS